MAVAPGDLDRIVSDKTHFERMDILADCDRLNSSETRHFIDASGTGAGESKLPRRKKTFVSIVPFDEHIMDIGAGNFGRNWELFHQKEILISSLGVPFCLI